MFYVNNNLIFNTYLKIRGQKYNKMEQCNFCSNMFGDKKMLRRHQKNTHYCLKIQETKKKKQAEAEAKFLEESKLKEIEELKLKKTKEAEELVLKEKAKELTCQFCGKQCTTKYILSSHQKQAKYCLKIQEAQNSEEIISSLVTCKFCCKNFSSGNFIRHDAICKKKNQSLIDENNKLKSEKDQEIAMMKKEQEISILKMKTEKEISILKMKTEKEKDEKEIYKNLAERFEKIAKQPTYQKNSTKNIQNNLMISNLTPLDLSQARVDSIIDEKYTKNDFYEGQKGAAQVIHKYLSTDSDGKSQIVCTDTERGTFHHIDVNGEHVVDYKNTHLINRVHLPLKRKASKFASEECVKNPTAYKDIVMNESSIRELETKPGLFNRTMAKLTGKNCVRPLLVKSSNIDLTITEELLIENAKFLTIEHILRGPEGFADYALSYPFNDRLIAEDCSDPTFVKYKDITGNIITEYGGKMLAKMLFDSVRERTYELIKSNKNISFEYGSIEDSDFQDEFISIVMNNI